MQNGSANFDDCCFFLIECAFQQNDGMLHFAKLNFHLVFCVLKFTMSYLNVKPMYSMMHKINTLTASAIM